MKHKIWKQILGTALSLLMIVTMFPSSVVAYAANGIDQLLEEPDVSVKWQPEKDKVGIGEPGKVRLTARLKPDSQAAASAQVSISLTGQEAEALQPVGEESGVSLSGNTLSFTLDQANPTLETQLVFQVAAGVTAPFDIAVTQEEITVQVTPPQTQQPPEETGEEESSQPPESTAPEEPESGTSSEPAESASSQAQTPASQAEGEPESGTSSEPGESASSQAKTPAAQAEGEPESGTSSEPPESTPPDPVVEKQGGTLSMTADFGWTMRAKKASDRAVVEDGKVSDLSFQLTAKSQNRKETGTLYTMKQTFDLTLTLPEGMRFPEGEYTSEGNRILVSQQTVASLDGLPEDARLEEIHRSVDNVLTLQLVRTGEALNATPAELDDLDLTLTIQGSALSWGGEKDGKVGNVSLKVSMNALSWDPETDSAATAEAVLPVRVSQAEDSSSQLEDLSKPDGPADGLTSGGALPEDGTSSGTDSSIGNGLTSGNSLTPETRPAIPEEAYDNIIAYWPAIEQNFYWVDNNNEENKRPDGYTPDLIFSTDGGKTYQVLTSENMGKVGLDKIPDVRQIDNTFYVPGNILPSKIEHYDEYGDLTGTTEIQWQLKPWTAEGYSLVDVKENDPNYPGYAAGWYYVLETKVEFTIQLRAGEENLQGIKDALWEEFQLHVTYGGRENYYDLDQAQAKLEPKDFSQGTATLSLPNGWKYNLDGSLITYSLVEKKEPNGELKLDELEGGDFLKISYDNAGAPNFGNVTDKLHPGGIMYLTLTGTKNYNATKVWLDEGEKGGRPGATFELWRYRLGEEYTTAAPVRNPDGTIRTIKLDGSHSSDSVKLNFQQLEKYDPEGYQYAYVVRETLEGEDAGNYEQVFGKVDPETGSIQDRVDNDGKLEDVSGERKDPGNTYLYNGGTLSNRLVGTVTPQATKTWKAAAFQDAFEDITVELTLQCRPKDDKNAEWKTAEDENGDPIKQTMDDFYAENLTASVSEAMPRYDYLGRELEYQWAETGVYQGENSKENLLDTKTGKFTLNQGNREVIYQSESTIEDGNTLITNSIANTIDYTTKKVWRNGEGEDISDKMIGKEVTFSLYQLLSGETLDNEKAVLEFTMDGKADTEEYTDTVDGETVTWKEDPGWQVVTHGLPEYDQEGHRYEYVLMESSGTAGYFPTYTTERDEEGNYFTTVINAPGEGHRIMVQKDWIDDSDVQHREPVTLQVYKESDNQPVENATITLGEDGVWYGWIGIGELEPEDVYVLETQVGDTKVPLQSHNLVEGIAPDEKYTPQKPVFVEEATADKPATAIQYGGTDHYYEATYHAPKKVANDLLYTVTNRRLGKIDFTVTKEWVDGDGTKREAVAAELDEINKDNDPDNNLYLALKLDFAEGTDTDGYKITYDGWQNDAVSDTVTIGTYPVPIQDKDGNPADSIQKLDLSLDSPQTTYYFYNLPKYDRTGVAIRYRVEEVWVDGNGMIVSNQDIQKNYEDLWKAYQDYQTLYGDMTYTVGNNHAADTQTQPITNKLAATKDILWHKQWLDDYTYQNGQRPDIYLNIYQGVRNPEGEKATVELQLLQENYKWTYLEDDNDDGLMDKQLHWHAEFLSMPKYDDYGYEIFYYALEHTMVDAGDFDYETVGYQIQKEGGLTTIGTVKGAAKGYEGEYESSAYESPVQMVETDSYALIENGTFVNQLSNTVTIQGQKIWGSLPNNYPDADLPEVTFTLNRSVIGSDGKVVPGTEEKGVASLTISDWGEMKQNGSYQFQIKYEGQNFNSYQNGDLIVQGPPTVSSDQEPALLPKYDELGRMYTYTLEENIVFKGGEEPQDELVFDTVTNTFQVTNTYQSQKGAVAVKKFLELPLDQNGKPTAYPAVKFELYRTYESNTVPQPEPELVETQIWTSKEVENAANGILFGLFGRKNTVNKTFVFENLDIYAPNGSEYVYTVKEVKTGFLEDYDTWVAPLDLLAGGDEKYMQDNLPSTDSDPITEALPVIANQDRGDGQSVTAGAVDIGATFINAPKTERETITLQGGKEWIDYSNAFGSRPEKENFELKLYRSADSQPDQGNKIEEQLLTLGKDYEIKWDPTTESRNQWNYIITGPGDTELERYAPNGMPWIYTVKEEVPDDYDATVGSVNSRGKNPNADRVVILDNLKNTIQTTGPSFQKHWVDGNGDDITEDYLGKELSVTFTLQVAEADSTDHSRPASDVTWQDAETYFSKELGEKYNQIFGSYEFTKTLKGRVNSPVWNTGGRFDSLPNFIVKNGKTEHTYLVYRAVESEIQYGDMTVTVTVTNNPDGSYTYTFSDNKMFSPFYRDAAIAQNDWNATDHFNQIHTTELTVAKKWKDDKNNAYGTRPGTSRNGFTWEVSLLLQRSADNGTTWQNVPEGANNEPLIVTLYGTNTRGRVPYGPITGLPTMDENGKPYTYRVQELQPGYTLENLEDSIVEETETFYDAYTVSYDGCTAENKLDTTTVTAEKNWLGDSKPVTLELQYRNEEGIWTSFDLPAQVTLDGNKDSSNQPYYENKPWNAIWTKVPLRMPGSDLTEDKTQYRVVETVPEGYEQIEGSPSRDGNHFTFTNVQLTSLTVEKKWSVPEGDAKPEVTVQLYRYTEDDNGDPSKPEAVGEPVTLNEGKGWTYTFTDLPMYTPDEKAYTYYPEETMIGDERASDADYHIYLEKQETGDTTYSYVIRNIPLIDIQGTKAWKDNGNAYDTRPNPDEVELTLYYRLDDNGDWMPSNLKPEWTQTQGDVWTYVFEGLPYADRFGNVYQYRVVETPVDGYTPSPDPGTISAGEYDLTNTLTGTVEVPVTKVWEDSGNALGTRPDELTLILIANRTVYERVTIRPAGNIITQLWQKLSGEQENKWYYTFKNLPEYDSAGKKIVYSVAEELPDGYELISTEGDAENGFTLTNRCTTGGLTVSKTVTGAAGNRQLDFHFTVTLEDKTITGTYGEMTFQDGVAEFTLKHGESVTADGLPAGVKYTVTEQEANRYGYRTTSQGETGTIPPGGRAEAEFVNTKNPPYIPPGGGGEETPPSPDGGTDTPPDPSVPSGENPQTPATPAAPAAGGNNPAAIAGTGDDSLLWLYGALVLVSAAGIAVLLLFRRRRRRKDRD